MKYIQFYTLSTGYVEGSIPPQFEESNKKLIEACGDRSVIIVDGRWGADKVAALATAECARRSYSGWRVFKGASFMRSAPCAEFQACDE